MPESINTVVIGAGVVGLACARAIAESGHEVVVIDKNDGIGQETSSRNSEVIHAGIYYPQNSLKAKFCVTGKHALYDYCEAKGVAHRRIGKLIVATRDEDLTRLKQIAERARRNGVDDLKWMSAEQVHELEPAVVASAALLSPSTGIIDTHALMLAFQADLEAAGGYVITRAKLVAARRANGSPELEIDADGETICLRAQNVVNCGGLHASAIATLLHGEDADIPRTRYARGVYFEYGGTVPFSRLIYPMPVPGGLGIHATLDLSGALRLGPDVEWIDSLSESADLYAVDPARAESFAQSIAHWWPALEPQRLRPGYAGIRPKLSGPDEPPADFRITATDTGNGRIVDLLGIESPGLTSALAIADYVCGFFR